MAETRTTWVLQLKDKISVGITKIGTKANLTESKLNQLGTRLDRLTVQGDKFNNRLGKIALFGGGLVVAANRLTAYTQGIKDNQLVTKQLFDKTAAGLERTDQELDSIASKALSFENVMGTDYQENLTAANTLMKTYKINQNETFDLMKKGFQSGANASGEFMDMVREYPTQLKSVGLNASQAIGLMSYQVKEGVFSDKGVDMIKEANLSLREMPDATKEAIDGLGISSVKMMNDINNGSISVFDAIQQISGAMKNADVVTQQTAIADIFRGAGEDGGLEFITSLENANLELDSMIDKSDPLIQSIERRLNLHEQIAAKELEFNKTLNPLSGSLEESLLKAKLSFFTVGANVMSMINSFTTANPVLSRFIGYTSLLFTGLLVGGTVIGAVSIGIQSYSTKLLLATASKNRFVASSAKASIAVLNFGKSLLFGSANLLKMGLRFLWLSATTKGYFISSIKTAIGSVYGLVKAKATLIISNAKLGLSFLLTRSRMLLTSGMMIASFIPALLSATMAQMGLNVAMTANPIGVLIVGIAALIGGIVLVVKHWDFLKAKIIQFGQFFLRFTPFGFIVDGIQRIFPNFQKAVSSAFSSVLDWFNKIWKKVKNAFNAVGKFLGFTSDGQIEVITEEQDGTINKGLSIEQEETPIEENKNSPFSALNGANFGNLNNNQNSNPNTGGGSNSGVSGQNASKSISMTLNITNNFSVNGDRGFENNMDSMIDKIMTKINDRLRDSVTALG